MKIVDTYPDILSLFNKMNGDFDIDLWARYIDRISGGLLKKVKEDSGAYDFDRQILPVIKHTVISGEKREAAHDSFLAVTEGLEKKAAETLGVDLQVDIILYLGLCNGAGWATELEGKPVVLLGIEKIVELDWCDADSMNALLCHELGHIWHAAVGNPSQAGSTLLEKSVLQLYQEGIAMYCEQLLLGDLDYYHQDKGGWLDWCRKNERGLNLEFLRRLKANESTKDFFGDWHDYLGHSDAGYFIGAEFIKRLARKYALRELAILDAGAVYQEFCDYAQQKYTS